MSVRRAAREEREPLRPTRRVAGRAEPLVAADVVLKRPGPARAITSVLCRARTENFLPPPMPTVRRQQNASSTTRVVTRDGFGTVRAKLPHRGQEPAEPIREPLLLVLGYRAVRAGEEALQAARAPGSSERTDESVSIPIKEAEPGPRREFLEVHPYKTFGR